MQAAPPAAGEEKDEELFRNNLRQSLASSSVILRCFSLTGVSLPVEKRLV